MGHKGFDPKEKQSSTVSANELLRLMLAGHFKVATLPQSIVDSDIRRAYRADVKSAIARFGRQADISITGRSIHMEGKNLLTGVFVSGIRVPLFGMLGNGEREALYEKTGIPALNPNPERRIA